LERSERGRGMICEEQERERRVFLLFCFSPMRRVREREIKRVGEE